MYIKKLVVLVAALGASVIYAGPSPKKTFEDFEEIGSLSGDVQRAIDRMPVLGYDASSVHHLFSATNSLVDGISEINEANAEVQVEDFDDQNKVDICRFLHRTRYLQASLIKRLGGQAERISQFPLTPYFGNLLDVYDVEMSKLLDEVNSRLDDCSDDYRQRLEEATKTARVQYAATKPRV